MSGRAGGDVRELSSSPNVAWLYARAAATTLLRGGEELPDTELVLPDVGVDRDHLAAYDRVCGFALTDRLPATYPHVLAFPLAVALMVDPQFPFALPGLVHVANRISVHRPVDADERLAIGVRVADLQPHPKGRQFDVVATAQARGEEVWTEASTYLRRGATTGGDGGGGGDGGKEARERGRDTPPPTPSARWRVDAGIGRRYAAVSGDRNPIHLHALGARLFGFPRAIAHGMWTKARCLAALEGRLPDSYEAAVAFAAPLLLPSTVAFASTRTAAGWDVAVHHARSGKPHLTGHVHPR